MIQADTTLTLSQDGTIGIIESAVVADDDATIEQASLAVWTSQQNLSRAVAVALTIGETAPDTVPDSLTTRTE